jgi:hypothetical protein
MEAPKPWFITASEKSSEYSASHKMCGLKLVFIPLAKSKMHGAL